MELTAKGLKALLEGVPEDSVVYVCVDRKDGSSITRRVTGVSLDMKLKILTIEGIL